MTSLLNNLDFIIFAGACLFLTVILFHFIWRESNKRLSVALGFTTIFLLVCWIFTDRADYLKRAEFRKSVEGYGPTFAQEIERMGHAAITLETPADDPIYLKIIEFQKRCLKVNPAILSIYTMRMLGDGRRVFIVDCEVDYNRDGHYQGQLEMRSPIGEEYEDIYPSMDLAIAQGRPVFENEIEPDRWGASISEAVPLLNNKGEIDGIVGVDFSADEWLRAIKIGRIRTLIYFGLVFFLLVAVTGLVKHQFAETALLKEKELKEAVLASEVRIESLVNSVKAVLWERDAKTFQFSYISDQLITILGYEARQWLTIPDCWQNALHPDDLAVKSKLRALIAAREPYGIDYRLISAKGVVVWLNESGVVVLDPEGKPQRVRGVLRDITDQKEAEKKLEVLNEQLVASSRLAGMSEMAKNVIQNMGDVLNSVDASLTVTTSCLQRSNLPKLSNLVETLSEKKTDLGNFFINEQQGTTFLDNFVRVTDDVNKTHQVMASELELMIQNIVQLKEVIAMQQYHAMFSGAAEPLPTLELMKN